MDATPFEQVFVVAPATKCTGDCTVLPFPGELTATPANAARADVAMRQTIRKRHLYIDPSPHGLFDATCNYSVSPHSLALSGNASWRALQVAYFVALTGQRRRSFSIGAGLLQP